MKIVIKQYHFTIIELLVVISIIATLAALLFPVIKKSRERSKQIHCMGNLRQLGIAITAYSNDNNDYLPVASRIGDTPQDPTAIQNLVVIKNPNLYKCLADNLRKYNGKTFYEKHGSSYEWNCWLNGSKIGFENVGFLPATALPLMWDADKFHRNLGINFLHADGRVTLE